MSLPFLLGRKGPSPFIERAEQLEALAAFMSRPDARFHVLERAAECRARAALVQAGSQSRGISMGHSARERGAQGWPRGR